jgi:hypothetical protein
MTDGRQVSTAETNMLEVAEGIRNLRGTMSEQEWANSHAADLEKEARQERASAAAATEAAWYGARERLANPGEEIDEREFLNAALAFAAIEPPKSVLPQATRSPARHRPTGFQALMSNPAKSKEPSVQPDDIVELFDTLRDGEPIIFPENQGLLTGSPTVLVREKTGGISIQFAMGMFAVDVAHESLGQEPLVIKLGEAVLKKVAVGVPAINHYAARLKVVQLPDTCGHGRYRSNLDDVEKELRRVSVLRKVLGLELDLTGLEAQVQSGKAEKQRHQDLARYRPRRTGFHY